MIHAEKALDKIFTHNNKKKKLGKLGIKQFSSFLKVIYEKLTAIIILMKY